MILEQRLISATNTDVLSTGRFNSMPYGALFTMQFLADLGDASNFYTLTIQEPDGHVPIDAQIVVASSHAADMVLDDRELMQISILVGQGSHVTVSLTETGTAVCAVRFRLA